MANHVVLGTVLVIGGSGFIGSQIVTHLLDGNHASSIVIGSRNPKTHSNTRVSSYAVDITSRASIDKLFDSIQPDVVIHTSTASHVGPQRELHSVNVDGTRNLLDAATICKATRAFVHTGSDSALQPTPTHQITEEEAVLWSHQNFNNHYGLSKAISDSMVRDASCEALRTCVLRLPIVYGEGGSKMMSVIAKSIGEKKHNIQLGDNKHVFDYVYVRNAALAHVLAARALVSEKAGVAGEAFFITDGVPGLFWDFQRQACNVAGHTVREENIKVVPIWVVKLIAVVGEWALWAATLGRKVPELRAQDVIYMEGGCWWSIKKAERVLGYGHGGLMGREEGLARGMKWAIAEKV
jgi:sterol-4alpha-carboxylate 3-dehydrogenase (decarboxylating)